MGFATPTTWRRGLLAAALASALSVGLSACGEAEGPTAERDTTAPATPTAPRTTPAEVRTTNHPPQIDRLQFEPERPLTGDLLRVVAEASDADGDPVFLTYQWQLGGDPVEGETPTLQLHGATKGDWVEVVVTASDGQDAGRPLREGIAVRNSPPRLAQLRMEPRDAVGRGTPIVAHPEAADPDGDRITFEYAWRVGDQLLPERGPRLATDRLRRGQQVQVTVTPTDGEDEGEALESAPLEITNSPPRIVSLPAGTLSEGAYRYAARAEDVDGDVLLRFGLEGEPAGMSIDSRSGVVRWQPGVDQAGTHSVTVTVDDGQGGQGRQQIEVTVNAPAADEQPPARAEYR